ncbi:MAG: FtsW/RodA/SpoVE family cell cycle protein [Patescibacteria group bacterium]
MRADGALLGAVILLLVVGNTILFSVDQRLFPLQFLYIGVAIVVFFLVTRVDALVLHAFAPFGYGVVLLFLAVTLVIGVISHGAIRWLPIGPVTVQPSEFAKPAIALMTAWFLSGNIKNRILASLLVSFLASLLVFIQPDFGTAVILGVSWLGAIFAWGVSFKTVFRFLIFFILLIPLSWFILAPYQRERLTSFLNPASDPAGAAYQGRQAMIAAGSGGLFGRGLGQGSQTQLAFLPARSTDFAFASVGEELGFVGMALVLVGFFVLFLRIVGALGEAREPFVKAALGGIFLFLFVQTVVNIAMNLGMLPIAGVPLPLISAGGSALVSTMLSLGIVVALRK